MYFYALGVFCIFRNYFRRSLKRDIDSEYANDIMQLLSQMLSNLLRLQTAGYPLKMKEPDFDTLRKVSESFSKNKGNGVVLNITLTLLHNITKL